MNYKAELIDDVFFVHWNSPPQPDDIRALLPQVEKVAQKLGTKFIYVSVVAPTSKLPNAEQRKFIGELLNTAKQHCSVGHMIMKGNDLQHNLQRVIVQTLLIVTRIHDGFLQIHKGTDTVAADITQRLGRDGNEIIRKAMMANVV